MYFTHLAKEQHGEMCFEVKRTPPRCLEINFNDSYHSCLFISARVAVEMVSVVSALKSAAEIICPARSEELHSLMAAHGNC